ncbi:TetR/AcrR family transcriptional regulator [soil metagenome]
MQHSTKKTEILDFAQELIQRRGYNGFSYADVSQAVGIRKASIHHHFPSKEDLAVAVVRRYRDTFVSCLAKIAVEEKDWLNKIHQYAKLYEAVLNEDRLCLCGMLASDIDTLPRVLKKEIRKFFADNVEWLSQILSLQYPAMANKQLNNISWQIISSLQGAVIMARMLDKPEVFTSASKELFTYLGSMK